MEKQIKLAFVWDFTVEPLEAYGWGDGLNAALNILAQKHGVIVNVIIDDNVDVIHNRIKEFNPDVILGWGSLDRPSFAGIREHKKPTALCFAGGPTDQENIDNFDIIFVENRVYYDSFDSRGYNTRIAFGTNEYLFQPMKLAKKFDGVYPAAFAGWKRHELFAKALGENGLAVGKILPNEPQPYMHCVDNKVTVMPQLPYRSLPYLYNQSHAAVITASSVGGSQRAVLEAMACNVIPIVMSDNEKCSEYVKESGYGIVCKPDVASIQNAVKTAKHDYSKFKLGREFILAKYSAEGYADKLFNGIKSVL